MCIIKNLVDTYSCCSLMARSGRGNTPSAEQVKRRSPSGDRSCLSLKARSDTETKTITIKKYNFVIFLESYQRLAFFLIVYPRYETWIRHMCILHLIPPRVLKYEALCA